MEHFSKAAPHLSIRPFTHEDIGFVISHLITLYETEYGFTTDVWKAYVKDGVQQFVNQFDDKRDCMYILECDGQPSGCIAITHVSAETAQLRFFFVKDTLRGLGVGHNLINMAINFCKEKQYKHIFLWTFRNLEAAKYLYSKMRFQIEEVHDNTEWGSPITEERWNLELK